MQKTTKTREIPDFAENRGLGRKSRNLLHPWNRDFLEGQINATSVVTVPVLQCSTVLWEPVYTQSRGVAAGPAGQALAGPLFRPEVPRMKDFAP